MNFDIDIWTSVNIENFKDRPSRSHIYSSIKIETFINWKHFYMVKSYFRGIKIQTFDHQLTVLNFDSLLLSSSLHGQDQTFEH